MGNFLGGSAFAMANQIADGHIILNIHHLKKLNVNDLANLRQELEKILRETRRDQPPLDQTELLQKRNRKIARINTSFLMLSTELEKKKKVNRARNILS